MQITVASFYTHGKNSETHHGVVDTAKLGSDILGKAFQEFVIDVVSCREGTPVTKERWFATFYFEDFFGMGLSFGKRSRISIENTKFESEAVLLQDFFHQIARDNFSISM